MNHYIRILCTAPLWSSHILAVGPEPLPFAQIEAAFTAAQHDQQTTAFARYLAAMHNSEHQPFQAHATSHTTIIHATLIVLKDRAYPTIDPQTVNEIFPNQQADSTARLLVHALDGICLGWQARQNMPAEIPSHLPQSEIVLNYGWAMDRALTIRAERGNTYLTQCVQKYLKATAPNTN